MYLVRQVGSRHEFIECKPWSLTCYAETLLEPSVVFTAEKGFDPVTTKYTVFFLDPDAPGPALPILGPFLHLIMLVSCSRIDLPWPRWDECLTFAPVPMFSPPVSQRKLREFLLPTWRSLLSLLRNIAIRSSYTVNPPTIHRRPHSTICQACALLSTSQATLPSQAWSAQLGVTSSGRVWIARLVPLRPTARLMEQTTGGMFWTRSPCHFENALMGSYRIL